MTTEKLLEESQARRALMRAHREEYKKVQAESPEKLCYDCFKVLKLNKEKLLSNVSPSQMEQKFSRCRACLLKAVVAKRG